jgi:transcriptional regulator with XRE-family HTH domain
MDKEVGNRIRKIRISKNYNVKYMADEIGMLDTSYSKIEREGTNNLQTLLKICKLLEIKLPDLIVEKDNIVIASDDKKQYGYATKNDVEEINQQIKKLISEFSLLRKEITGSKKQIKPYKRAK